MPARHSANIPTISTSTARRMLMHAQGLLDDPQRSITSKQLYTLIERMGFVQIDTINVLERAHHLTLFSRAHSYQPPMLARLVEDKRSLWEHWTHDASIIPAQWFSHWRHRFDRYRSRIRRHTWWKSRLGDRPDELIDGVRKRIEREGALQSKDFEHDRTGKSLPENGWWGWKPQKAALEHLWRSGELAIVKRINFQKVYDLTSRVLPDHHATPASAEHEHAEWACRSALERLGFATPSEIAAFWNAIDLAAARRWCAEAARRGDIVEVFIETADGTKPRSSFALTGWEQKARQLPDPTADHIRLLSPFDPVLRDRKRALRLFQFDFTFEAFVPAPKRRYGYYVLPILRGDQLIGRLDPKFHRDRSTLEIKGLWWEPHVKVTRKLRASLEHAVQELAAFVGAASVALPSK